MPAHALTDLADERLLSNLSALVSAERQNTAALLTHLAEVEERKLYRIAAYSTMHEYCVDALHLSDDSAYKRLRAARAARRFPQLLDAIADGRLHLSGVVVLAPHLTDENVDGLVEEATHRRKLDIEIIVARLARRPDVPDRVRALAPEPHSIAGDAGVGLPPGPNPSRPAELFTRVKPLAPERFALQTTISQATREKLERAKALTSHRNPSGELGVVLDAALDALIVKLEKQKFAVTARPRVTKARRDSAAHTAAVDDAAAVDAAVDADPTYVPADVRRAVYERDGGRCTFTSADGRRCTERRFLELDHATMVCRGGQPTVDGIRLRCKAHNQHAAEEALGADFMRAKREAAARDRDVTRALRGMGFNAAETNRAMNNTANDESATFEERIRAALAELMRMRGSRCSDGPPDDAAPWTTVLAPPVYRHLA
jgi:hypothetical protein